MFYYSIDCKLGIVPFSHVSILPSDPLPSCVKENTTGKHKLLEPKSSCMWISSRFRIICLFVYVGGRKCWYLFFRQINTAIQPDFVPIYNCGICIFC